MHPLEFVSVEPLVITGFAARTALQGRILLELLDGERLLAIGAKTIKAQIHLTKSSIDPLEARHTLLHLGQIETAGQINQLIPLAVIHFFRPLVTPAGFELIDQLSSYLRPVSQQAFTPHGQPGLRHFTHTSPQQTNYKSRAV